MHAAALRQQHQPYDPLESRDAEDLYSNPLDAELEDCPLFEVSDTGEQLLVSVPVADSGWRRVFIMGMPAGYWKCLQCGSDACNHCVALSRWQTAMEDAYQPVDALHRYCLHRNLMVDRSAQPLDQQQQQRLPISRQKVPPNCSDRIMHDRNVGRLQGGAHAALACKTLCRVVLCLVLPELSPFCASAGGLLPCCASCRANTFACCQHCVPPADGVCPDCGSHWDSRDPVVHSWVTERCATLYALGAAVQVSVYYRPCTSSRQAVLPFADCMLQCRACMVVR